MSKKSKILLVGTDFALQDEFEAKARQSEHFVLSKIAAGEKEALDYMERIHPHIVITELSLMQGDGMSLLRNIRQSDWLVNPYVIGISHMASDVIIRVLNRFVDYVFNRETVDFGAGLILQHLDIVKDILFTAAKEAGSSSVTAPMDKEERLRRHIENNIVNRVNLSPNLKGRGYIIEGLIVGIGSKLDDEDTVYHTKDIYPILRKRYKNSERNINTAIRVALEHIWNHTDEDMLKQVYGAYINPTRGVPTPGEFLKYYIKKLRDEGWTL